MDMADNATLVKRGEPKIGVQPELTIIPRRAEYSRAAIALAVIAMPWAAIVTLGTAFAFALFGVPVPEVPALVRWLVGVIALAPIGVGLVGSLVGPRAGFTWMFRLPVPRLRVSPSGMELVPGRPDDPAWTVAWSEIEGLLRHGFPERIKIVSARGALPVPRSLSVGIAGDSGEVVRFVDLVRLWLGPPSRPL
jgi:hypothetical protein